MALEPFLCLPILEDGIHIFLRLFWLASKRVAIKINYASIIGDVTLA